MEYEERIMTKQTEESKGTKIGWFLKKTRKERKVTRSQLCYGLCTETALARYEQGKRIPDKFLADAFFERLGLIPYQFEFVDSDQEFQYRILRNEIEKKLRKKESDAALAELDAYEAGLKKKDFLHRQYILLKRAEIALEREDYKTSGEYLQEGFRCTKIAEAASGKTAPVNRLFTDQETRLVYDLIKCLNAQGKTKEAESFCRMLKQYMDAAAWDKLKQKEYSPYILYCLARSEAENHNTGRAWEYLEKAKKILLENYRMDHLCEILELENRLTETKTEAEMQKIENRTDFLNALRIVSEYHDGQISEKGMQIWENTAKRQL